MIAALPVGETSLPGAQADNKASTKAANVDLETMCLPLLRLTRVAIKTPSVIPVAPPPFDHESRIVSHLPSPITVAPIRCFREHYRSPEQRGNRRGANGTLQHRAASGAIRSSRPCKATRSPLRCIGAGWAVSQSCWPRCPISAAATWSAGARRSPATAMCCCNAVTRQRTIAPRRCPDCRPAL